MLEETFGEIYTKFKLNFYRGIFEQLQERESSLSAAEAYAVEVIFALKNPTVRQFADFLQISQPNATYKVNALIRKGYIKKEKSLDDGREYHLCITPKFSQYYAINEKYQDIVMQRIRDRFSPEETKQLENMLQIIARELMTETKNYL